MILIYANRIFWRVEFGAGSLVVALHSIVVPSLVHYLVGSAHPLMMYGNGGHSIIVWDVTKIMTIIHQIKLHFEYYHQDIDLRSKEFSMILKVPKCLRLMGLFRSPYM